MNALEYRIDPAIFAAHPGYRRGVLVVQDASNGRSDPGLVALLREEEAQLRARLFGSNVAEHPAIASWREAYRRFGAKPSEHRSSIEAMARRVTKPDQLPSIHALVDIGNLVSLRYLLPAGVHPLPPAGALIELRPTMPGDRFVPADGGAAESPADGEVVFCQGHDVLTRRWTWRQAAGTQTLPETSAVFFNIDGLPPISDDDVRAAMADIARLASEYTGATVAVSTVLSMDRPALVLARAPSP
jgi:DNA/RNA-binding domain of Phe-tRNA-synthetase-like protein